MDFPQSRKFILKKVVFFQELNNLVVNKPFINCRQNRQYIALVNYFCKGSFGERVQRL